MNISFFDDKPNLDELDFKIDFLKNIKNNVSDINSLLNMLFYGVPTCGKTTKIYAFLATLFDKKIYDLKNIEYEEDRKTMVYRASIYHIEINPLTLGSNEKIFIQSFLKSYVETRNIGLDIPKIVLIKNADMLSNSSKMALRKIIEKTTLTCTAKFIFEVSSLSKIPLQLLSRFFLIKLKMPKINEIKECLINFSKRKNIVIEDNIIDEIINDSLKISYLTNMKKIFGFYRYYVLTKNKFKFLYHDYFDELVNLINGKKISFVSLQKIRELVNEMYINLIPMDELLLFLFSKYLDKFKNNNELLESFFKETIKVDTQIKKGNKECLHIEYYIISIIELLH